MTDQRIKAAADRRDATPLKIARIQFEVPEEGESILQLLEEIILAGEGIKAPLPEGMQEV